MSRVDIEHLLYESECDYLDFKEAQYPFSGATDDQKSELLKDIVAFANAWRRTDAYILVGVREVRGGRSIPVGVEHHLDEHSLQQFVHSKLNRHLQFNYFSVELDGVSVGVIRIPCQLRPYFLLRGFGRLKASTVYIRRGSSTGEASPDEIASMRETSVIAEKRPLLVAFLNESKLGIKPAKALHLDTKYFELPPSDCFPSYPVSPESMGVFPFNSITKNQRYFYELARYLKFIGEAARFELIVKNEGNAVARDVKCILSIRDPDRIVIVHKQTDIPEIPQKERGGSSLPIFSRPPTLDHGLTVKRLGRLIEVSFLLGKIQAKDSVTSGNAIYLGAKRSVVLRCSISIFSDDLDSPVTDVLEVSIDVEEQSFDVKKLIAIANDNP